MGVYFVSFLLLLLLSLFVVHPHDHDQAATKQTKPTTSARALCCDLRQMLRYVTMLQSRCNGIGSFIVRAMASARHLNRNWGTITIFALLMHALESQSALLMHVVYEYSYEYAWHEVVIVRSPTHCCRRYSHTHTAEPVRSTRNPRKPFFLFVRGAKSSTPRSQRRLRVLEDYLVLLANIYTKYTQVFSIHSYSSIRNITFVR